MNEVATESAESTAREAQEAELVSVRIKELRESPIQGKFDADHLKSVHAWLFQDFPEHLPGIIRNDTTERWTKQRVLEGRSRAYEVHYAHDAIEARISRILKAFGGARALKGKRLDAAAGLLAGLYGDLDHAHGFHEGNSRTLREFIRELSAAAGYRLDWIGTGIGAEERNQLYTARDILVLERAFPGLTPERAMQTDDRAEYEAEFTLTGLRRAMGGSSLQAIIRGGLSKL
ncbi:MAG: hypothetical protein EXR07_10425 [Acetobacteraceae bacterium]|nr:hypothetical protein [Acetobacteraceae bacterium]